MQIVLVTELSHIWIFSPSSITQNKVYIDMRENIKYDILGKLQCPPAFKEPDQSQLTDGYQE